MKKTLLLLAAASFLAPLETNAGTTLAEARQMLSDLSKIMKQGSIDSGYNAINGFSTDTSDEAGAEARATASDLKNRDQNDDSVVFCVEDSKIVAHPTPSMIGKPYADTNIVVKGLKSKNDGEVALSTSTGGGGLVDLKTGKPIGGQSLYLVAWDDTKLLGSKPKGKKRNFFCAASF